MPVLVPDKVNMNYANMIEEKSLKKTFIIATLVSTLVGTFAASHNLYERLSQKKKDGAQDDAIKKLGEKIDTLQQTGGGNGGSSGGGGNGGNNGGGQQRSEELRHSLDSSGLLIRREYDVGYDRLGRRFAIGDLITENELQKQIIMLQQTVIRVLEDAMYNNRYIDRTDIEHLAFASQTARDGSLDALRSQYQRLLLELPPLPPLPIRSGPPPQQEIVRVAEVFREPAAPSSPQPKKAPPALLLLPPPPPPPPPPPKKTKAVIGIDLFCRYSLDLQRTSSRPLSRTFDPPPPGRSGRKPHCPACHAPLAVDASDMWEIDIPIFVRDRESSVHRHRREREGDNSNGSSSSRRSGRGERSNDVVATATTTTKQRREIKRFRIPARFVIKCHTPEGDYACVLCFGPQDGYTGERVVLCEDPEGLVDHVAREHRVGDIENEWDILPG